MTKNVEISLFILRIVLGITFLIHGVAKFQMGLANVAAWFQSIGLIGFLGYLVATIELVAGIALIIGFATRIACALISLILIGAIFKVKLAAGFLGNGQMAGYELDLALLSMAIVLLLNGSRLYALESKLPLFSKNEQNEKVA
jgi:uncharacterized membrane protein YphA (DoxX/SURF4 family)